MEYNWNTLECNCSLNGEGCYFSLGRFANHFYRIEVLGPDEEDVCVRGSSDTLTDHPNADVIIHVRHGLPRPEVVDRLFAATLRWEEGSE